MVQKKLLGCMFMLAITTIGCQNDEISSTSMEEGVSSKNNVGKVAAADVSVNAYVDTSVAISTLVLVS